ncbi:TonB-dependent receptor [Flavobacterium reichenbachii]|uniref:TonB-dependent receptor n=1 Tax=Flavobacterium reichenbachii TaxID=362418 RepID=A0A085ZLP5_9FLAO|nr:TonB-dependent receptor [Flavobacterium reichenbachii]KFF05359.1 TonB-dependent receptor [Flavobacterium reichenbachii]OXB12287.1 TonB-dependent siderophore receptor [Flavobacterium reichenbachii]
MKFTYILLLCAIFNISSAQNAKITGKLVSENNEAISYASISIKSPKKGAITDDKGNFEINDLTPGNYTLYFTAMGFTTQEKTVELHENENLELSIRLQENINTLQTVEITGRKEKSYRNTKSFIGAKTEIALKDLPQAVSYATKELIADQGSIRVGEVVKNFSGVSQFTFYDDISIRGFRINGGSNTQLLNGMRTSTGFWKQPLANYLERVEVLKGPSSALFGNASPGGVLNRVTKKPLDQPANSVSFSTGSFNTLRALADFTGPLTQDKSLLYRLNLGYENANSFRDLQFDKNIVFAPSLSFLPNDKTSVNFDLIYTGSKSVLDRGQSTYEDNLYSTKTSNSLNSTNDYLNEETYIITTSLNHQFTDRLSFSASYIRTGYTEDLLEHRGANKYASAGDGTTIPTAIEMQVFMRKRKRYIDNLSAFFKYQAKTGIFDHNLIAGYDYAQEQVPAGGSQLQATGYRNAANTGSIATYNPNNKAAYLLDSKGNPVPNVAHFDLTNPSASQQLKDMSKYFYAARPFDPTYYSLYGVYIQDHVKFGAFQALIGIRYDEYSDKENYKKSNEKKVKQHSFLPRFGLTYTLNPNINLYGTYVQGYNPQTASSLSNPNAGGPFDPLESSMIEFGGKSSWFKEKLFVTVALFKIQQKNTLYPANDTTNPDLMRSIGEEESKGIEIDINGNITRNWSVSAAYSYNEAYITDSPVATEIGRQKPNTPVQQGNIWTRYNFTNGIMKDFGIAMGSNFVTTRNLSQTITQTIPGYTLFNAALYYNINKFKIQLNANNITNKTYWVGGYDYIRLFPGAPSNWLLTLGYSF